jgi:4-hydroxybenzoate polyprenyltransferase
MRAIQAWGRLVRLSLAPSAIGDVAAGVVLGAYIRWPSGAWPFVLILGSLCVYHGGMALNDWADRKEDARVRPDRPIPSGAIRPGAALGLALVLLLVGPLLAATLPIGDNATLLYQPWFYLTVAASAAALYDVAGRGPWLGPGLLALCRFCNLSAGLTAGISSLGSWSPPALPLAIWSIPFLYAGYVFIVSRLGRLEDMEGEVKLGRLPSILLGTAAALLVAVPVPFAISNPYVVSDLAVSDPLHTLPSFLVAGAGAFGLARVALGTKEWTKPDVLRSMGMALRRLIVFTAAIACLAPAPTGLIIGGLILCGFPLSFALRRVFPPS